MRLLIALIGLLSVCYAQYETVGADSTAFNCDGQSDGNYGSPCSPRYFSCVAGTAVENVCPEGLVFNQAENNCDYPDESCGGEPAQAEPEPIDEDYGHPSDLGYGQPIDDESGFIDCSDKADGFYSHGCSNAYTVCSFGTSTLIHCPNGLVFDGLKSHCTYPDDCGRPIQTTTATSADIPQPTNPVYQPPVYQQPYAPVTTESPALSPVETTTSGTVFDCQGKEDGEYAVGCSSEFVQCVAGFTYHRMCPAGLLYSASTRRCEVSCDVIAKEEPVSTETPVTQQPYVPVVTESPVTQHPYAPITTEATIETTTLESVFDCQEKEDGLYSVGCSAEFYQCVAGFTYHRMCSSGLFFNSSTQRCEFTCDTVAQEPAQESTVTPFPAEPTNVYVPEPTQIVQTTAAPVVENQSGCVDGDTSSFGQCSSKFKRCKSGNWKVGRCPGMTVFDETIGLCIYDLPRCKTTLFTKKPETTLPSYGTIEYGTTQTPSTSYQTAAAAPVAPVAPAAPGYLSYPQQFYRRPAYVSNPFYAYRRDDHDHDHEHRRGRHFRGHKFDRNRYNKRDYVNKGQINYKTRSVVVDGRRQYVRDMFKGIRNPYAPPMYNDVFISARTDRRRPSTTTIAPGSNSVEPDAAVPNAPVPNAIFASAPLVEKTELVKDQIEGSGLGEFESAAFTDNSASTERLRSKRSYGLSEAPVTTENLCATQVLGSLVSLGSCRQDFVYCESSTNDIVAACPVGELFDDAAKRCVSAYHCGEPADISVPDVAADMEEFIPITAPISVPTSGSPSVDAEPILVDPVPAQTETVLSPSHEQVYNQVYDNYPAPVATDSAPVATDSAPVATDSAPVSADAYPSFDRSPVTSHPAIVNFDTCDGKMDGYFAVGCSNNYFVCQGGRAIEMVCQDGLVFDQRRIACDYKYNVAACGPTSVKPPVDSYVASPSNDEPVPYKPTASVNPTALVQPTIAVQTAPKLCKGNGFFAVAPCSKKYVSCKNGAQLFSFTCSGSDVFSERFATCVSRAKAGCPAAVDTPIPYVPTISLPKSTVAPVARDQVTNGYIGTFETTTFAPSNSENYHKAVPSLSEPVDSIYHVPSSDDSAVPSTETEESNDCPARAYSTVDCSNTYKLCGAGVVFELNCPAGLIFDRASGSCEFPQFVAGCETFKTPGKDIVATSASLISTEETSNPEALSQKESYDAVIASDNNGYTSEATTSASESYASDATTSSTGLAQDNSYESSSSDSNVYGKEQTFESTTTASNNYVNEDSYANEETTASNNYVKEDSTASNSYASEETTASNNYVNEDSTASNSYASEETTASNSYASEETTASNNYVNKDSTASNSYTSEETTASNSYANKETTFAPVVVAPQEIKCTYGNERTSFAIGECFNSFKICTEEGRLINANCDNGQVFDSATGVCVLASSCGAKPTPAALTPITPCSGKKDNELLAYGECRESFMRCINGASITEHCPRRHVFHAGQQRCLPRERINECSESQVVYMTPSANQSEFCVGRRDGLYRDPKMCSGIIQCFGGELFARPSCPTGLVFNEKNAQCDYRYNVPGCEEVAADPALEGKCRGEKHGAYLADSSDCSIFYRCVWDKLEKMSCPSGTVFNPVFSVCDWPANVPHCFNGKVTTTAAPSADEPIRPY